MMKINRFIVQIALAACLSMSAMAQVNDGSYKGTRIVNGEEQPEICMIYVRSLGNGTTIFSYKEEDKHKPLEGTYHFEIYGNRRHIIGNFSKGIADGKWIEYMYDKVFVESNYKQGKLDGKVSSFRYSEGEIYDITTFKEGVKQSYVSYHPNGNVKSEEKYNDQGQIHGKMLAYDEQGKIVGEANYKLGKYHGKKMETDENGFQETVTYYEGEIEGDYVRSYPNGNKQRQGRYLKGEKKDGKWTYWQENGEVEAEEHYQNGKLNGKKRTYYKGGMLALEEEYVDDQLNGKRIEYEESPYALLNQATYKEGKLDGEFKAFNNGQLWRDCMYKAGKLISEKEYKNGKINVLRIIDESGNLVDVQKYNETGKSVYKNNTYKKPASIILKEDASGVIDIDYQ